MKTEFFVWQLGQYVNWNMTCVRELVHKLTRLIQGRPNFKYLQNVEARFLNYSKIDNTFCNKKKLGNWQYFYSNTLSRKKYTQASNILLGCVCFPLLAMP